MANDSLFKHDLTELVAAIARIEARASARGVQAAAGVPAAEPIKDIILALRDLARRVDAMITLAATSDTGAMPATDTTPDVPPGPPPAMLRAAATDSLAALRALSEEELIALFS